MTQGIRNIGNTCFLNSFLQCLRHSPVVMEQLVASKTTDSELASKLRDMFAQATGDPAPLVRCLRRKCAGSAIVWGQQNDFNDVCMLFIKALGDSFPRDLILHAKREVPSCVMKSWHDEFSARHNWVHDVFYGQQLVTVACGNCNHACQTAELFTFVNVFPTAESAHLTRLFSDLYLDEPLPDYRCESCKAQGYAKKTYCLFKLPGVLMICVHRPTRNTRIHADDVLVIGDARYQLTTVVHHKALMGGNGHYWTECKLGEHWYCVDDDAVNSIEADRRKSHGGFVYVFSRVAGAK